MYKVMSNIDSDFIIVIELERQANKDFQFAK